MAAEEIDLTCSQEEDSEAQAQSRKRKDVVNVIDTSPTPKKLRYESDKTNITSSEWKEINRRLLKLENVQIPDKPPDKEQYVTRQEFFELARRLSQVEERVQNIEQVLGNVKAAFLFENPSKKSAERNSSHKPVAEISNVTSSSPLNVSQANNGNEETPLRLQPSTSRQEITYSHQEKRVVKPANQSSSSYAAKPQKSTSNQVTISRSSGSVKSAANQQQEISGSNVETTPMYSTSSTSVSAHYYTTPLPSTSSSQVTSVSTTSSHQINSSNFSNSPRVQAPVKKPALQDRQVQKVQRTPDTSTATPITGPMPKWQSTAAANNTPNRKPNQRPPLHNLNKQNNNLTIPRTTATSTSIHVPFHVNHELESTSSLRAVEKPGTSSAALEIIPIDQTDKAPQKQKKIWELPDSYLQHIRIKREIESEDTNVVETERVEPANLMREDGNFVFYIAGMGRKIRGHPKYVAIAGFSYFRNGSYGHSIPDPFFTDLKDIENKPYLKQVENLKTEALVVAALKAIQYVKRTAAHSRSKVIIIASTKSGRKMITNMQSLQIPERFSETYFNFHRINCDPSIRWETKNSFADEYKLHTLLLAGEGIRVEWRDEEAHQLVELQAKMDSRLTQEINKRKSIESRNRT